MTKNLRERLEAAFFGLPSGVSDELDMYNTMRLGAYKQGARIALALVKEEAERRSEGCDAPECGQPIIHLDDLRAIIEELLNGK